MNPLDLTTMNRRQAIQTLATAGIGVCLADKLAAQNAAPDKPTLHVYDSYGWLRGFNVIPSWGARIEDAWWNYDGAKMREELALARSVHANAICLWIEFTAWYPYPEKVTTHFLDAIAAIDENGMKVMPCLFNRWHNANYDYGGTYERTLRTGHEWMREQPKLRALWEKA